MKEKKITENIFVEARYLNSNLKKHLEKILRKKIENKCTKEHGYITKIGKILSFENQRNTQIMKVTFTAQISKPESGEIYSGDIQLLLREALVINIENNQKVLVSAEEIKNFTYDEERSCFYNDNSEIVTGDTVKVKINLVRYSDGKFTYCGTLV